MLIVKYMSYIVGPSTTLSKSSLAVFGFASPASQKRGEQLRIKAYWVKLCLGSKGDLGREITA